MRHLTKKVTTDLIPYSILRILVLGIFSALSLIFCSTTSAQCISVVQDEDFELQRSGTVSTPWIAEGRAGIDIGRRLSYHGSNNAWARNNTGWNAIRQPARLTAGVTYTLRAFVRTSGNVTDGYFGFRDAVQHPVSEIKFGSLPAYTQLRVKFRPNRTGRYNIFTGFWAPGQDAWIQVDNVSVMFPCNDVDANPGDN